MTFLFERTAEQFVPTGRGTIGPNRQRSCWQSIESIWQWCHDKRLYYGFERTAYRRVKPTCTVKRGKQMEEKMTLAELFALAMGIDPSLISETLVNRRTGHTNGDGDVYYLFNDGSIYSFKSGEAYTSLDSMKDLLLDYIDARLCRCETLDDVLKLKCAWDVRIAR